VQAVPQNPCQPSPCGPNAVCQVSGDGPSCSCLPDYTGAPPNCRPECVSNSECAVHLACMNLNCRDPCPGSCGANAECRVVSHTPTCVCVAGYTGDPFTQCVVQQCKGVYYSKIASVCVFCAFGLPVCFPDRPRLDLVHFSGAASSGETDALRAVPVWTERSL
jgi:hypothetical protein